MLLWWLVAGVLGCKVATHRWPWELWAARPARLEAARARSLLGVAPSASREEIIDAHKRLLLQVHPDRGGSNELVHEANAARDLLLARLPAGVRDGRG